MPAILTSDWFLTCLRTIFFSKSGDCATNICIKPQRSALVQCRFADVTATIQIKSEKQVRLYETDKHTGNACARTHTRTHARAHTHTYAHTHKQIRAHSTFFPQRLGVCVCSDILISIIITDVLQRQLSGFCALFTGAKQLGVAHITKPAQCRSMHCNGTHATLI